MKKTWMVVLALAGLTLCLSGVSFSQTQVAQEWANRYVGGTFPNHNTGGLAITVDASGNSYVTGMLPNGNGNLDIVTTKYDTYGNQKWVMWFDRGHDDIGYDIVVDELGYVYVTGYSVNTSGNWDAVTIKYDGVTGLQLWAKFYDGGVLQTSHPKDDCGVALVVNSQFVYVAAWSYGEIPEGASTLTDYATIKYDRTTGDQNAVARYNDPYNNYDEAADIAVDAAGNVYVTGRSYQGSVNDFDYLTIKYDQNLQNAQPVTLNSSLGQDFAKAIALDGSGNIYVTGGTGLQGLEDNPSRPFDLTTVRYSSSMVEVWRDTYNDPDNNTDHGDDIVVDPAGYVYVTGVITTSSAPGNLDIGTVKYNNTTNGGRLWVKTFGNSVLRDDDGNKLALDRSGNVYVIGTTQTAASPNTDRNSIALKYDNNGNLIWNIEYNGIGPGNLHDDLGLDIALDPAENIYVTGPSYGDVNRYDYATVKYNQRIPGGFSSFQTEPSQGRHLVRDQWTGELHLVMIREDNKIAYAKSTDNGASWVGLQILDDGKYPTVCIVPSLMMWTMVCVAYKPTYDDCSLMYQWFDPGIGQWQKAPIATSWYPGPPSIVTDGFTVYVAYRASSWWGPQSWYLFCNSFPYYNPSNAVIDNVDLYGDPEQPCLAYDGEGNVHAAWRRAGEDEVYYSKRVNGVWWTPELVDQTPGYLSTQPFVECYGESVFVVWSQQVSNSPSDVRRAARENIVPPPPWVIRDVSYDPLGSPKSESPTQAWQRLTTWSEGTTSQPPWLFDINYWRADWGTRGVVMENPMEWSYWVHSQMTYNDMIGQTYLWTAWTESPNEASPPFRVLTNWTPMPSFFGPGEEEFGPYYRVLTGRDTASVYCKRRDGVMRFGDKAVDFSRDSLVYELPFLDPNYDYYLKVTSYRETGNDWVQGVILDGILARTVQFAPNRVDSTRVRIPPELYTQDRKVRFVLKNVRGDYVTGLGLTLFQRDPKPRRKGGGQAGEPVSLPVKEVFAVYPNPVHSQAQVEYSLKASGKVSLSVYDIMGRHVRSIEDGVKPAGVHKVSWDGRDASGKLTASGVYFVRLSSSESTKTARLVVVR
jgi:hypothetical protein